jgi:hypothetical protein
MTIINKIFLIVFALSAYSNLCAMQPKPAAKTCKINWELEVPADKSTVERLTALLGNHLYFPTRINDKVFFALVGSKEEITTLLQTEPWFNEHNLYDAAPSVSIPKKVIHDNA